VYVEQRQGFVNKEKKHLLCKLKKAWYDFKQASRVWYKKIYDFLHQRGLIKCKYVETLC